jgi:hypothetical protein
MDTEKTQAPEAVEDSGDQSVEELLSAEFDRMEAGEAEETETVIETGDAEEADPVVVDDPESEVVQASDDVESAEASGYNEPAPERWPANLKEHYDKLDPDSRKLLMEQVYKPMQRQYTDSTQELAGIRRAIEPMVNSMNQYRNDFERMGVQPEEAFRTQMAWAAHFARVGPAKGVADMQAAYGLNSTPEGGQEPEVYLTPVERGLKDQLNAVQQSLAETSHAQQTHVQQQSEQSNQAYVSGVRNELLSFINEQKDGKAAHPHVEKVAPAIAGIIRGGLVNKVDQYGQSIPVAAQMQQAYDMACRLDPSISTAPQNNGQAGRAIAAQNADVVANTPSAEPEVSNLTMSEQIEANYDKLNRKVG